jgi:hypothetical protein
VGVAEHLESLPDGPFKICTSCERRWDTREQFLDDPTIVLLGYQSFLPDDVLGLFMFNHDCGTTLTIRAARLEDLHDGPIYRARRDWVQHGAETCLASSTDHACPPTCECEYVKHVSEAVGRKDRVPTSEG